MIIGVYTATYTAANAITTMCEHHSVSDDLPKFFGVAAVNTAASVAKDAKLAVMTLS